MDLYLVRHAVAHKRDADRWPDDSERPLTPKGEAEFRERARGLSRLVPTVGALLSSPYSRAWRTAGILAGEAGWPDPAPFPALEPDVPPHKTTIALDFSHDAFAKDANGAAGGGPASVALVGHRPGLHELASYLLTGEAGAANVKIKKGGVICIRFAGPPVPGEGELRWLIMPEFLGE